MHKKVMGYADENYGMEYFWCMGNGVVRYFLYLYAFDAQPVALGRIVACVAWRGKIAKSRKINI